MNGECKLCLKSNVELQESHIVPKFVWRWLKETTPGKIRTHRVPNQRIQDGPKIYLLCSDCEQKLSDWEKPFREEIFIPLHDPEPARKPIYYGNWAIKFSVSVSWRVLTYFNYLSDSEHHTQYHQKFEEEALETWRKFILGDLKNPGRFSQHLLPTDVIQSYQGPRISPFLNRYLLRSVHMDVISTEKSAYVYTKMCRLILFGRIFEKNPKLWKGMQLHARKGDIHPIKYLIPAGIDDYLNRKADEVMGALDSISPRQQKKVDKAFYENIDEVANSEVFRAMYYDVAHSGEEAFSKRDDNKKEHEQPNP